MPHIVLLQGPYNAFPTGGLGPDLVGIQSASLAARNRTVACSNTINQGLEKIQVAERLILHLFLHSAPTGKRNFLLFF